MARQHDGKAKAGAGKREETPSTTGMKTYLEGTRFPGRIGRTYAESEPAFPVPAQAPPGAPNILYVVIDDLGFGACDTFGGLIETPHITRLANNGLRYVNFHTTALCSPTRACLLTGRNHHSVGMANITEFATGFPGYDARQKADKAAIGAMLHQHGYTSYALGKWHNTPSEETGPAGPFDRWPDGPLFGFDRFYGFLGGDSNQWFPKLYAGRTPIDQPRLPKEGYHLSEDLVDKAIEMISSHASLQPDRAVVHLSRVRCVPRAAPRLEVVGRHVSRPVRHGLGRVPRAGARPPEGARGRARERGARADARRGTALGRSIR